MKMLKDNSLKAIIGMIAFAAVLVFAPQRAAAQSLSAQLTDKDIMVSEFNAVNVSDDFDVTVSRGTYGVRLTVDKELAPYVEVYVRSKVLYISYDEKAVPKELRKVYRGKGGLTPTFRVVAYTPELQAVTLSDNAILTGVEEFAASDFELTMAGKSQVRNLPEPQDRPGRRGQHRQQLEPQAHLHRPGTRPDLRRILRGRGRRPHQEPEPRDGRLFPGQRHLQHGKGASDLRGQFQTDTHRQGRGDGGQGLPQLHRGRFRDAPGGSRG